MSNIVKQEPLQKINTYWQNPFIHKPPAGLEDTISFTSENMHTDPLTLTVRQNTQRPFKPVIKREGTEDNSDYGQYVEMGGKKKRRTRRKKHGKKSKKSKKSRKIRRKY